MARPECPTTPQNTRSTFPDLIPGGFWHVWKLVIENLTIINGFWHPRSKAHDCTGLVESYENQWKPMILMKSMDFQWFRWSERMLGTSTVTLVDSQPKRDKRENCVSNFLKQLRKARFRGGINCPTVWSGASLLIVVSNILKSMHFIKTIDFRWFS